MLTQKTVAESTNRALGIPPASAPRSAADGLAGVFELMGAAMCFEPNCEIYGQAEPAEYFYKVVGGAVRTYKLLSDGRRQIGAFHLAGDFFGLDAAEEYQFTAEAIAVSTVLVVKRSALVAHAARDGAVARELWSVTATDLRRAQNHMLLLGRKSAEERVASFLLDIAMRQSNQETVELPMSRQDIADYLGLTIETISRTLTHLESTSTIELPTTRRITLRNRSALQRLNA